MDASLSDAMKAPLIFRVSGNDLIVRCPDGHSFTVNRRLLKAELLAFAMFTSNALYVSCVAELAPKEAVIVARTCARVEDRDEINALLCAGELLIREI